MSWQDALYIRKEGKFPPHRTPLGAYQTTVGLLSMGMIGRLEHRTGGISLMSNNESAPRLEKQLVITFIRRVRKVLVVEGCDWTLPFSHSDMNLIVMTIILLFYCSLIVIVILL